MQDCIKTAPEAQPPGQSCGADTHKRFSKDSSADGNRIQILNIRTCCSYGIPYGDSRPCIREERSERTKLKRGATQNGGSSFPL